MKSLVLATLVFATACASQKASEEKTTGLPPVAQASLQSSEEGLNGSVTFKQEGERVRAVILLEGLKKNSTHGIHIHEKGLCQGPGFKSAGDHFDPEKKKHGDPKGHSHHLGDLGNVTSDGTGKATKEVVLETMAQGLELQTIVERAVILHAKKDDLKTQPSGDSGDRIACGVIKML